MAGSSSSLFETLLSIYKSHEQETKSQIKNQPKHLPWLMLPCDKNRDSCKSFFNVSNNKVHHLKLPEVQNKICCGSSHGWLIMVDEQSSKISLLNPLTRETIRLPPVTISFSFHSYVDTCLFPDNVREKHIIHKVVLSANPTSSPYDYVAMAIYGKHRRLALYKSGDRTWTLIKHERFYYEDVIYYDGGFFAVDYSGGIVVCHVVFGETVNVIEITPPWDFQDRKKYLVNSDGKLLLVNRYIEKDCYGVHRTVKFSVFELDSIAKPKEWFRVDSLGNSRVLFLGQNHSLSLLNSSSDCQGNCIYFTDDHSMGSMGFNKGGVVDGNDFGVFDLEDGCIKPMPFHECDTNEFISWPTPTWLVFEDEKDKFAGSYVSGFPLVEAESCDFGQCSFDFHELLINSS